MNEFILGNNCDKYMINPTTGTMLMNGKAKACPITSQWESCGAYCMHLNLHKDGVNKFALMTCTGIVMKIKLVGGAP